MAKQSTPISGRLITLSKDDFENSHIMCNDWADFLDKLGIPDDPDAIVDDKVTITVIRCHYDISTVKNKSCEFTDQPPRSIQQGSRMKVKVQHDKA
tara:strand:+ start:1846 stop:2133 length:288 start_codon:yes stop_codon:yes gene_type:complete